MQASTMSISRRNCARSSNSRSAVSQCAACAWPRAARRNGPAAPRAIGAAARRPLPRARWCRPTGAPFDWLEDRGPRLTLLGVIDDATGQILALTFRAAEDLHGYTGLFHEV